MTEITKALLEVQLQAPSLQRDKINPHFGSRYLSLESLMEAVLPVLNDHGVVLVQSPTTDDGPVLVTRLIHAESGEEIATTTPLLMEKQTAQSFGSAMTYARRYALMAMLGLSADADDDGAEASKPKAKPKAQGKPREFDPGRDLLPSALKVQTEEDANSIRLAQRDLWPDEDWPAVEAFLVASLFDGAKYDDLDGPKRREFWTRLANAIVKAGAGDFPPPTREQVQDAYAYAFKGTVIALSEAVAASEGSDGESATPDDAAPENASGESDDAATDIREEDVPKPGEA